MLPPSEKRMRTEDGSPRTVAECVAARPIFDIVMEEERQPGTPTTRRWWEQAIDFEAILEELQAGEE